MRNEIFHFYFNFQTYKIIFKVFMSFHFINFLFPMKLFFSFTLFSCLPDPKLVKIYVFAIQLVRLKQKKYRVWISNVKCQP